MERADFTILRKLCDRKFLLNTLYGTLDEINFDFDLSLAFLKKEEKEYLLSRKHFQSTSQKKEYWGLYREYRKLSNVPVEFYIPLTDACNLDCSYCFQKNSNSQRNLHIEVLEKIILNISDIVSKLNDEEKSTIVIFGGEPLLPQNYILVERILSFSHHSKIPVRIITNGTNINHYKSLLKLYKDCIIDLVITVDGEEELHNKKRFYKGGKGSYKIIMEGLSILKELEVNHTIRVNLTKDLLNYNSLYSINQISHNIMYHRVQYEEDYSKNCSYTEIYKWIHNGVISTNQMSLNSINYFEYLMDDSYLNYPIFNYCNTNKIFYFSLDYKNIYCCNEKEYASLRISDCDFVANLNKNAATLNHEDVCEECVVLPLCGGGCKLIKKGNHYTECPYYLDIIELVDYYLVNVHLKESI